MFSSCWRTVTATVFLKQIKLQSLNNIVPDDVKHFIHVNLSYLANNSNVFHIFFELLGLRPRCKDTRSNSENLFKM